MCGGTTFGFDAAPRPCTPSNCRSWCAYGRLVINVAWITIRSQFVGATCYHVFESLRRHDAQLAIYPVAPNQSETVSLLLKGYGGDIGWYCDGLMMILGWF